MSEARTYEGGCHCGKVRYTVKTDLAKVMDCNCSICSKKAYLLTFVQADAFELKSGQDSLTDYQFNRNVVHHQFCSTCGIQSFGWGEKNGQKMYSVNVRCLDGVDLSGLTVTHVDGKKF